MKKYLFLDLHGVVSVEPDVDGKVVLCPIAMGYLRHIQKHTGCVFVITSSVRKSSVAETKRFLSECGFAMTNKIVGITIRAYKYINKKYHVHLPIPRGVEVKQWMDANIHSNNGKDFKKKAYGQDYTYAILDNSTAYLLEHRNNLVVTESTVGLTMQDAMSVIQILNQSILNFDHE